MNTTKSSIMKMIGNRSHHYLRHTAKRSGSTTTTTNSLLHTNKVIGTNDNDNDDTVVFLHGLLGNGNNLKTMAKRFGGGILVDLRGHGKSGSSCHVEEKRKQHTFENCAEDVLTSVAALDDASKSSSSTIVGHSFGGRVALECAMKLSTSNERNTTTWLLDTVPGQAHESVVSVLETVESLSGRQYETRAEVSKVLLEEKGMEKGLAHWLASGMTTTTDDKYLEWGFDIDVATAVLPEFGTQDFYGKLRHLVLSEENCETIVHLVRGGTNSSWSMDILTKLQEIQQQSPNRFHLHVLPKAGHWVHVDDLPGLLALWQEYR